MIFFFVALFNVEHVVNVFSTRIQKNFLPLSPNEVNVGRLYKKIADKFPGYIHATFSLL